MTSPLSPDRLAALRALADAATPEPWTAHPDGLVWSPLIGDPVSGSVLVADAEFIATARSAAPALIAEVERLRTALDREDRAHAATVADRDRYHDAADRLADAIARVTGDDIGEHSSDNDPWENALSGAERMGAEVDRLRADVEVLTGAAVDGMADPLTLARWVLERDQALANIARHLSEVMADRDKARAENSRAAELATALGEANRNRIKMLHLAERLTARVRECDAEAAALGRLAEDARVERDQLRSEVERLTRRSLSLNPPAAELRDLIRALRAAGWWHTTHWQMAPPGYPDGYPDGEDYRVHQWTRNQELIQTWTDSSDALSHVLYEQFTGSGDLADMVTVGHNWIEQRGFAALHRLADAVGVTEP